MRGHPWPRGAVARVRQLAHRVRHATAGERGSATVLAVGAIGVIMAVVVAALSLTAVAAGARQAASAADQVALAVAGRAAEGASPAASCAVGADLAERGGARLVECGLTGPVASVRTEVTVSLPLVLGGPRRAVGRARAGPDPRAGPESRAR